MTGDDIAGIAREGLHPDHRPDVAGRVELDKLADIAFVKAAVVNTLLPCSSDEIIEIFLLYPDMGVGGTARCHRNGPSAGGLR